MSENVWRRLKSKRLTTDMASSELSLDRMQIEDFYIPLAKWLLDREQAPRRLLVAIAGPPGSGKSAFTSILAECLDLMAGQEHAIVVGQDGWHYSNRYLAEHSLDKNGKTITLRSIKGSPESFDSGTLLTFLEAAKTMPGLAFPRYSRELHEPIPDSGAIQPDHRVILLEGNYLLLQHSPWDLLLSYFDATIFLSAIPETLIDGLRSRHLRGGKSAEAVEQHIRDVDLPNIRLVLSRSADPDITVIKRNHRLIDRVEYHQTDSHATA